MDVYLSLGDYVMSALSDLREICSSCDEKALAPIVEEVDIGVGLQEHIIYWECTNCGEMESRCDFCGSPSGRGHEPWCASTRERLEGL